MDNPLLSALYEAIRNKYFIGYPSRYSKKRLTVQQRTKICYILLTSSVKHLQMIPWRFSVVLGPFPRSEDTSRLSSAISNTDGHPSHTYHTHLDKKYLIARCNYTAYSHLSLLPCILPNSSTYVLRVPMDIPRIPHEVLCSKYPGKTVQILNFPNCTTDLLTYLSIRYHGVLSVKEIESTHIIRCTNSKVSTQIVKHLCGKQVNGSTIYAVYYPEALAEIQLYYGKN
ncbi:hypothetical protein NEFER01_0058 [Nematocida sp. LUAm1]|nr:hypothetical protein NEFER02_0028 [Nematocida sp. LUAm2]KAI5176733.1 hypothetical protein NEFER01_0058 [Nematocida sp. LUAm1]